MEKHDLKRLRRNLGSPTMIVCFKGGSPKEVLCLTDHLSPVLEPRGLPGPGSLSRKSCQRRQYW